MNKKYKRYMFGFIFAIIFVLFVPTTNVLAENALDIVPQTSISKADRITELYLTIGTSQDLKCLGTPSTWKELSPIWTSSNDEIVKINENGVVTGVTEGTAMITFSLSNQMMETVKINVGNFITIGTNESKSITKTTLQVGETIELDFYGIPVWNKKVCKENWSVIGTAVSVNEQGIVTAIKAGTAKVNLVVQNTITGALYNTSSITIVVPKEVEEINQIPKLYFEGDISNMQSKKDIRNIIVRYEDGKESFSGFASLKVQGTSSLGYEKKNYTIKFYKDIEHKDKLNVNVGWGGRTSIV